MILKLFILITLACCNEEIYTDENYYPETETMGHIKAIYDHAQLDYIIYNNNQTPETYSKKKMSDEIDMWMKSVGESVERQRFLVWIMDLPHSMTFRSQDLLYIDQTPEINHCVLFAVYNSEDYPFMNIQQRHALKSLLVGLNELFLERCAFATVDVSYPPNKMVFEEYTLPDAPAVIFRNPVHYSDKNRMIYRDLYIDNDSTANEFYLKFNPNVKQWGHVRKFKDIKTDLELVVLELLHKYSTESTQTMKAQAIYQPQYTYNMGDGIVYHNITALIRKKYFDKIWEEVKDTKMNKCKTRDDCTEEENKVQTKNLSKFLMKKMEKIWTDLNLDDEFEQEYVQKRIKQFNRESIRIKPKKLPEITKLFMQWNDYFSPDHEEL